MKRAGRWGILLLATLLALVVVAIPVMLIRPFAPQSPGGVALAFTLRRWSPWITLVAAALGFLQIAKLWRASRWWGRVLALVPAALLVVTAWGSRQDYFEWMFHPLPGPGFVKASDASFVAPSDMVLAVSINGESAAYPIRQIAYHHVLQDSVGRVPIVATY